MSETRDRAAEALEIARLAALDPVEYDRQRQAAAERLGVRVSTLDEAVQGARPKAEATDGRGVALAQVEPWPEPVNAEAMLGELAAAIKRHVILPASAIDCCTLWIAHTWVHDRFQHSPRLSVTSPVKRCGKSTLLDVLRATSHRPLKADNISASGVFRTVEALRPLTLLVDEADTFLGDNEELRGILNSGFERTGEVIRVVEVKGEWQPIRFATFCPVALAGIGTLPGTLEDRAVPIVLQRKAAAEVVVKLRTPGARAALHTISRKLARWAADRAARLPADPSIPDALGDREGDISVPLLAIADDAGGEWPHRAREALLTVFGFRSAAEGTMESGALLLRDIKLMFAETSSLRMPSADIVRRLGEMEERPWPEWRNGKPMTAPQLARALNPFGVRPATIRFGVDTAKGYHREAFDEAWSRYLPSENPAPPVSEPSQRHKPRNSKASDDNQSVTADFALRTEMRPKPSENLGCDGVTAPEGVAGGEEDMGAVDEWLNGHSASHPVGGATWP
jgi:putative DNA primase/helicase